MHSKQGIPLGGNLIVCLTAFLEQTAVLIQRLNEATVDLCVFCRNNNETFETYTSHKVSNLQCTAGKRISELMSCSVF